MVCITVVNETYWQISPNNFKMSLVMAFIFDADLKGLELFICTVCLHISSGTCQPVVVVILVFTNSLYSVRKIES